MSSGKNPLVLMMALSMPGAANALGLGDIHVDSGLNERLAAEIDIVGATSTELTELRAAVADRETFLHYGADRPGFLSSTTFKVTQDSQGRPVLAVRSSESFTEPVVNFLVDLHWHNGEMIRQYTLLLDPPGFAASMPAAPGIPAATAAATTVSTPAAPSIPVATAAATTVSAPAEPSFPVAPVAAAPIAQTKGQTVSRQADPPRDQADSAGDQGAGRKTTHIKIGAKATLRGIAWRVGERSESDLQRMMIAIFRANPSAFEGNINRMRRGTVLAIPARADLAAISKTEAKREVQAQMSAWRSHTPAGGAASQSAAASPIVAESSNAAASTNVAASSNSAVTPSAAPTPNAASSSGTSKSSGATMQSGSAAPSGKIAGNASDTLEAAALGVRVQSMEQELREMKGLMDRERDQLVRLQRQAVPAGSQAPLTETPAQADARHTEPKSGRSVPIQIAAGLGVLAAAFAGLYFRFRRRVPAVSDSRDGVVAAADTATDGLLPERAEQDRRPNLVREAQQQSIQVIEQHEPYDEMPAGAQAGALDDTAEAFVVVDEATQPSLPRLAGPAPAGRSEIAAASSNAAVHEPTVNMHLDTVNLRADPTRLDYNLLDLDLTAQHVQMPSVLNEHAVVKERRTNLADVLKLAIEREPDRHDLRMKLLELYYSAASTNRRAFLDVVQKLARDRGHLQGGQWDKIAFMGRQIAAENPLFAEESESDDLADCA
jgi:pilus assembly protein FimV